MLKGTDLQTNRLKQLCLTRLLNKEQQQQDSRRLYFDYLGKLVRFMTNNSLNLKKTKAPLRPERLQEYLRKYNQFLRMVRCKG